MLSFNPCFNGSVERGIHHELARIEQNSFNPCFNGSVERGRLAMQALGQQAEGFNPCFNGSVERGRRDAGMS